MLSSVARGVYLRLAANAARARSSLNPAHCSTLAGCSYQYPAHTQHCICIPRYGAFKSSSGLITSGLTSDNNQTGQIRMISTSAQHLIATSTPCMHSLTLRQLHERGGPPKRKNRQKSPISGYPQIRGTVIKVVIRKPKKPNSGNRRCVVLRLTNGKELTAWIPGEGHNLQEHSQVLIEGGRKQDLIGIRCRVIRGRLDCAEVQKKPPHR